MTTNRIIKVTYDGHHDRVCFRRVNGERISTWPPYSRNRLFTLVESLIEFHPHNLLFNRAGWVYTNQEAIS